MFFYLVMLGVIMGWVEQVYGAERDKPRDIPATHLDRESYLSVHDISGDIPEFLLRPELIPTKEPDDTPLLADAWVRAGGGG
ncbi:MAG: hypothetical protein V3U27_21455 [Candidatus Tectomicrobia bacterium]